MIWWHTRMPRLGILRSLSVVFAGAACMSLAHGFGQMCDVRLETHIRHGTWPCFWGGMRSGDELHSIVSQQPSCTVSERARERAPGERTVGREPVSHM